MASLLTVSIEGFDLLKKKFASLLSADVRLRMNREIGFNVQERTADHIARASVSRHKTADRLGAPHSGFLEFAPGRIKSESKHQNEDGSRGVVESRKATDSSVEVVVCNTPGLSRAFHSLVITPKKAKALTIPINAVAYAKSVRKVRQEGYRIHRRGRVLMGDKGGGTEAVPLFVLCGQVTVPQDRGLLPMESELAEWAADSAEVFLEMEAANAGL